MSDASIINQSSRTSSGPIRISRVPSSLRNVRVVSTRPRDSPRTRWCFTSYRLSEAGQIVQPPGATLVDSGSLVYICWQLESCPTTNRVHVQGYLCLSRKCRLNGVKDLDPWFATVHLEGAKGTTQENIAYCSKPESAIPDSFISYGIPPVEGTANSRQLGIAALQNGSSLAEIWRDHPSFFIQSARNIADAIAIRDAFDTRAWTLPPVLYGWQESIMLLLRDVPTVPALLAPHDRRINWIYDREGGKGKSTLIKLILSRWPLESVLITSTSSKRVVEALHSQQHVVMLDLPRAYPMSTFNYAALETIKDGIGCRTMYAPGTKLWRNPHLFVFSNELPDFSKLTKDRWFIWDLGNEFCNFSGINVLQNFSD